MANGQHGGYRRPTNPAPASGPGALSRRTDGMQPRATLPDAAYGEQQAFQQAQGAAPMSGDIGMAGPDLSSIVPLDAPTQRPDEPIMAGMPGGPGAGPSVPRPGPSRLSPEQASRLRAYLPVLVVVASQPNADPNTKAFVRALRAELG